LSDMVPTVFPGLSTICALMSNEPNCPTSAIPTRLA
jgi:hypothetical protein